MLVKEAEAITGGLSAPGKMPEHSWNISAHDCNVGSKLVNVPGSVCFGCYALKGRYLFPIGINAQARRLAALADPRWVEAMIVLVGRDEHFRWFDAGDIQGMDHLLQIIRVVEGTPQTNHWLPTKEYGLVNEYLNTHYSFPKTLVTRVSAPMVDGNPVHIKDQPVSVVSEHRDYTLEGAWHCPAKQQGNQCGSCRACWDPAVKMIEYPFH